MALSRLSRIRLVRMCIMALICLMTISGVVFLLFLIQISYKEIYSHNSKIIQQIQRRNNTKISNSSGCDLSNDWDTLLESNTLTGAQIIEYFMWTNSSSCQLSHDFGGVLVKNPTGISGQKAVCIDSKIAPKSGYCLVYSFGINNEWSFDEHIEQYGCEVYAFDPSMGMDHHDHSSNIHFYNWGLSDIDEYNTYENWTLRSLSSIYDILANRHGFKLIDYLKIDIEFYEWIALPQIMESDMLSKVRQLGIEVHLDHTDQIETYRKWAKILRTLEKKGMIRFDSKYNPWSAGNFTELKLWGSFGYEIAWYNENLLHV